MVLSNMSLQIVGSREMGAADGAGHGDRLLLVRGSKVSTHVSGGGEPSLAASLGALCGLGVTTLVASFVYFFLVSWTDRDAVMPGWDQAQRKCGHTSGLGFHEIDDHRRGM